MPGRMAQLNTLIVRITSNMENREIAAQIMEFWENAEDRIIDWAKETLMPGLGVIMQKISSRVILTLKTLLNLIIGVIVCVYFLDGKDKFKAQIKKVITALFRRDTANEIFEFGNYAHHAFGGFITGKIIDSIIIGVICFISMSIFRLPYPLLISVIVGVTNIIPFFGPFIGAVPSALIILMVSPIQALYFLILVIILQQLDGNIIGPAILGNSTGLSSFWVLFSIVIFGGLFGPVGMIIGVPVFAVIYYYAGKWIRKRLRNIDIDVAVVALQLFDEGVEPGLRLGRQRGLGHGELHAVVGQHHRIDELAFRQLAGGLGALQRVAGRLVQFRQLGVMAGHAGGHRPDLVVHIVFRGAAAQARQSQRNRPRDHHLRRMPDHASLSVLLLPPGLVFRR